MLNEGEYMAVFDLDFSEVEIISYENIYKILSLNTSQKKWLIKEWVNARMDDKLINIKCNMTITKDEGGKMTISWSRLD